ncbi:MAG: tetratricopeptide repeat protein [Sedimentisphaerales bacterium]|nr:tetratricopeptide repeat protein [Sedimentisphaerales bacterium]
MEQLKVTKELSKIIVLLLVFVNSVYAASTKQASVLLQEALYAEEIEGDINTAIKIYQQIIDDDSAQENYVAQALYRQGMCYMKVQNENQAKGNFTRLVTNFSDQTNIIEKVKPLLEDIGNADPAALMPPETLFYAEIGSPGKQIETIFNMLKGSPLENPWALIGDNMPETSNDQMGNIVSGLLNPSMMAELRKIRGMGVGITGIPQNDVPPGILVLFPGKSDALKGLLQMVLTMVGKPVDSIEGMNCIEFTAGGGAAYNDSTVIMVSPLAYEAGQLEWCVKQYKGITNEPTLASSNKSFAQVSKQARQSNALTIWADINSFYTKLMEIIPPDAIPVQIHIANGIVDFKNIKDLIASLSIEQNSVSLETNIALNGGHNCIAYNMIRTPNLNKNSFQAIPPETIGLLSFALNDAASAQAASIGSQLQNITGLDFGREIFGNIEQITLFLTPAKNTSAQIPNPAIAFGGNLGLAITSRNPQQTRQIIEQLLTIPGLVTRNPNNNQTLEASGKYTIDLNNGMKLNCCQNKNTTIISLNPEIIDASLNSIQSQKSAMTEGVLKKPISEISSSTSKILMLNLGGFIQTGQPFINAGSEETTTALRNLLGQIASECKDSTFQMRTNESQNNFNIRAGIFNLPPLSNVFTPIMQIVNIMPKTQQNSGGWEKIDTTPVAIAHTDNAPVIDGKAEQIWEKAKSHRLENRIYSNNFTLEDLDAVYSALWDKDNLYVYVHVVDDSLKNDSDEHYQDDSIEIFIDADNSKSGEYSNKDYQYYFSWDKDKPSAGIYNRGNIQDSIKYKLVTHDKGYSLEVMFPWATLGTKAFPGAKIGLDIHVNDDDDGGDRDSKITWRDTQDSAWENTKFFGTAELADMSLLYQDTIKN